MKNENDTEPKSNETEPDEPTVVKCPISPELSDHIFAIRLQAVSETVAETMIMYAHHNDVGMENMLSSVFFELAKLCPEDESVERLVNKSLRNMRAAMVAYEELRQSDPSRMRYGRKLDG